MKKIIYLLVVCGIQNALAFDVDDYASTFRATQDAFTKADRELYFAEAVLSDFISSNREILPFSISSFHKIGSATQAKECYYQEACAKARSPQVVLNRITELVNDKSVRDFIIVDKVDNAAEPSEGGDQPQVISQREQELNDILVNTEDYYSRLNPDRIDQRDALFLPPVVGVVWLDTIVQIANYQGMTDPFTPGIDSNDKMYEFRRYRDAYVKALHERSLALPPYRAAQAAYASAAKVYTNNSACSGARGIVSVDEWVALGSPGYETLDSSWQNFWNNL